MSSEYGIFYGDDLFECDTEYLPIIDKFLHERDIMCISAKPKVGKTVLVQQIAFSLTTGKSLFGCFKVHNPCNVLYIQAEGSRSNMIKRFKDMSKQIKFDMGRFFHINIRGIGLHNPEHLKIIMDLAAKPGIKYDVIIFDPLYKLFYGGDLNKGNNVTMWTDHCDQFLETYGAAGIVIHHETEKVFRDRSGVEHHVPTANLFGHTFWSGFFTHTFKLYKHSSHYVLKEGVQRSGDIIKKLELNMIIPQNDAGQRLFFEILNAKEFALLDHINQVERLTFKQIQQYTGLGRTATFAILSKIKSELMKEGDYYVSKGGKDLPEMSEEDDDRSTECSDQLPHEDVSLV